MKFTNTITTASGAIAAVLAGTAIAMAGAATAASTGGASAADTVKSLQSQGYNVQLNGTTTGPLSQCTVTGVHGLSNTDAAGNRVDPTQFTTVYVDISCPPSNN